MPICYDGSGGRGSLEGMGIPRPRVRVRLGRLREIMIREKMWARQSRKKVRVISSLILSLLNMARFVKVRPPLVAGNPTLHQTIPMVLTLLTARDQTLSPRSAKMPSFPLSQFIPATGHLPRPSLLQAVEAPGFLHLQICRHSILLVINLLHLMTAATRVCQSCTALEGYPRPVPSFCRMVLVHGTETLRHVHPVRR